MSTSAPADTADHDLLDVVACDKEPIRIPGSIQPHGILFVLDGRTRVIRQLSENAVRVLSDQPSKVVGETFETAVAGAAPILTALEERLQDQGVALLGATTLANETFNAVAHRAGDTIILELEFADAAPGTLDALYPEIGTFVQDLQNAATIDDLNATAVRRVRQLTGFDRVLIYRFDENWNGVVVAEDRNERLPSYYDLRFPASDIPAQARDLYRLNRLRLIPDADYLPVPIVPTEDPQTGKPTDLTFSVLRSVSPIHVEYMKNMGTPSSMSISILIDGQLWGLISCHSANPKRVPAHIRAGCDFLGQILAMQIAAKNRSLDVMQRIGYQAIQTRLLAAMAVEDPFIAGLINNPAEMLALVEAQGAAIVFNGAVSRVGTTCSETEIRRIVEWLTQSHSEKTVFATDALSEDMPDAEDIAECASGLLAVSISQLHPSYVLWLRPEVVQTVNWGGDPRKPNEPDPKSLRLHPRKSFELWKETVKLRSLPWTAAQVDTAALFRNAIVGIVMRKAEELAQLTDELKRSNKELEAFSYSVSHDLRAPFRHIVGYAELLKEDKTIDLKDRGRRYLDTIIESAFSAGKLVDDLLGFSQMGRSTLLPVKVNLNRLVREVKSLLAPDIDGRHIDWHIDDLPPVYGDPSMLRLVMQNLISNAVKYTRTRDPAVIEIRETIEPGETIISVHDNGVGFDMAYIDKLFGIFQRLHRMEDYEGTGIGLANVRRIVERHGGRTWAEGEVDKGATFYFSIPHQERE